MKNWLDRTFLLTEEEIAEGYEVHGSDYCWVAIYILVAIFGLLVGLMFN